MAICFMATSQGFPIILPYTTPSGPELFLDASLYDHTILPQADFNILSYQGVVSFFHVNTWIGTGTRLRHR